MKIKISLFSFFLLFSSYLLAQVPKPSDVFGFRPGEDYKLANYDQMLEYYNQLEASSNRVKKIEIGKSVDGEPMLLLFISSEENLKHLDQWKEISQKLARAKISEKEAEELAQKGKAIVWIDGGMHAVETAHGQMTPELAYRAVTEETAEMKKIRENVIFLLMPMMNPDGVNIVSSWYKKNLGTPYETTSPPWLWQRYVGHDNNRDWFMGNLPETQAVMKQLYREWFPQIVYNQHQDGSTWKRMYIPPYNGPVNQNIHPGVTAGVNEVGAAMARRYALNNMPGVISRKTFSMWWNGGGRTVPYYHNQIGILTEMSHNSPTPSYFDPAKRPKQVMGIPTDSTAVFYPDPWLGGESHLRDAVDYMLTSSMATLKFGADRRYDLLYGIYKMGRDAIKKGEESDPFAYVIPKEQWDEWEASNLINSLFKGGIEIERATQDFTADGQHYEKGSYILRAAQSFRPYLKDLLEKQRHPNRELYPGGPPEKPYDLTGWTLPMQMGVRVDHIKSAFTLPKTQLLEEEIGAITGKVKGKASYGFVIAPQSNASFKALNTLFKQGAKIERVTKGGNGIANGAYIVTGADASSIEDLGLDLQGLSAKPAVETVPLSQPKVATYMSWIANMDEGWTRFMLERHGVEVDTLHNAEVLNQDLSQYNTIIIPSQSPEGILHGYSKQQMAAPYTGGLGSEGTQKLKDFVEAGGTLITFDQASDYAIEQFGLPVKNTVKNLDPNSFFIPGSLIRAKVDTDQPLAFGMQEEIATMFSRSRAFELNYQYPGRKSIGEEYLYQNKEAKLPESNVEVIVRYSDKDLLMSGWALGEENLANKAAMVRVPMGKGQIVMFAFRPQFRDQPRGSYKLIFNSIIQSAEQK